MQSYSGPKGPLPNDAKTGPKGEPMAPISSASLIVLCPLGGDSSSSSSSSNSASSTRYATLMLQRSARDGSSFRSAVVFPGGALDLADEDAVERMTQDNLTSCNSNDKSDATDAAYLHSLRLCALRETFEETGLLLLPTEDTKSNNSRAIGPVEAGIEATEWKRLRDEVHDDARAFPPFLKRVFGVVFKQQSNDLPPLAPMSHHSNWVTPRGVVRPAKRFDAHFFLTVLDKADALGPLTSTSRSKISTGKSKDSLNLSADGTETTSLTLATAEEMIESAIQDTIVLFPPQFYILADLAATLRTASIKDKSTDMDFTPLIFRHPTEPVNSTSKTEVTPVEEEPRGLHPDSHYQFEKNSEKSTQSKAVTSVEPRAMPASGRNVNKTIMPWGGQEKEGEDDEHEPFVFPLVLPGDFLASGSQRSMMSGKKPSRSKSEMAMKPLNRVYVTPRSREDGGGVIVRGARRRGLPGLMDFEEGAQLQEMGAEGLEEDDDDDNKQKAKL